MYTRKYYTRICRNQIVHLFRMHDNKRDNTRVLHLPAMPVYQKLYFFLRLTWEIVFVSFRALSPINIHNAHNSISRFHEFQFCRESYQAEGVAFILCFTVLILMETFSVDEFFQPSKHNSTSLSRWQSKKLAYSAIVFFWLRDIQPRAIRRR